MCQNQGVATTDKSGVVALQSEADVASAKAALEEILTERADGVASPAIIDARVDGTKLGAEAFGQRHRRDDIEGDRAIRLDRAAPYR